MRLPLTLCCLFVLLVSTPANACLWYFGTDIDGKPKERGELPMSRDRWANLRKPHNRWQERITSLKQKIAAGQQLTWQERNDLAVAFIHMKKVKEGLEILLQLEQQKSNQYEIAANLGTAFELLGDDKRALQWIKTAIDRNPYSHGGSEWIHVKILQAKLAMKEDKDWLSKNSILGITFGDQERPVPSQQTIQDHTNKVHSLNEIRQHLGVQLQERISLVPSPDVIVADLLMDMADLSALTDAVEMSVLMNEMSLKYKPTNPKLAKLRGDYYRKLVAGNPLSGEPSDGSGEVSPGAGIAIALTALVSVSAAGLCLLVFIRRRYRSANKPGPPTATGDESDMGW